MGKDNEVEITKEERWEGVAKEQVFCITSSPFPSEIKPFLGSLWLSDGADRAQAWKWLLDQEFRIIKELRGGVWLGELRRAERVTAVASTVQWQIFGLSRVVSCAWLILWLREPPTPKASMESALRYGHKDWPPPLNQDQGPAYERSETALPKAQGFELLQCLTLLKIPTGVKHQGEGLRLLLLGF